MSRKAYRLFLLSPARLTGKRAEMLLRERASFDLAVRLRAEGAELGEVFAFLSGLYFRGKLAYGRHFARPYPKVPGVWVITSSEGLLPADKQVTAQELKGFSDVPIDPRDRRYVGALQTSALRVVARLPENFEVVLLGSIGTNKYVELLLEIFGTRLKFPPDFVGRGDMSRGGLLLRCVTANKELQYVPLLDAVRHGKRPPKLEPLRKK